MCRIVKPLKHKTNVLKTMLSLKYCIADDS